MSYPCCVLCFDGATRIGIEFTHENLFPNFYIINLPSIIGIQLIDGVGENIVKPYGKDSILYISYVIFKQEGGVAVSV